MLDKIKQHYNLTDYEMNQLTKLDLNLVTAAYNKIKYRKEVKYPFRTLIKIISEDFNNKSPQTVSSPSAPPLEPEWVKDYKHKQSGELISAEDIEEEIEYLKKQIKSYKASIEIAKKNYSNNSTPTTADLRYIENYLKGLHKAQQKLEKLTQSTNQQIVTVEITENKTNYNALDIAGGITNFMDEERLKGLGKFLGEGEAIIYRDKALKNWLLLNFEYDNSDINHQIALKIINKYRMKFNLPPKYEQISNITNETTDNQPNTLQIENNSTTTINFEADSNYEEVYEW